ncbi:MAG: Iron transporter permease [Candidatus Hydrogenedentes bacterium]|nr:Iron transporter permease [Candidatus Hydrogenedentota bacterium]
MTRRVRNALIVLLLALCMAMVAGSLLVGSADLSLAQAWQEWRNHTPMQDAPALSVLMQQRLPRTLAALIAGCGLALAGCSFQALLRNPLATPYTLGIASAGALGAWTATILTQGYGFSLAMFGPQPVQALAFLFAAADMAVVYFLAATRTRVSPSVLLLAGVTMGMLSNSGILLMRYLADPERLVMMDRWLMGGVDVLGYQPIKILFIGVMPCVLILLAQASKFDQLGFGVEVAAGRGVNVKLLQIVTFVVGSLMTAIIVSIVGPIGFVGLLVPHGVRTITGSRHRMLMPLSAAAGGGFLCFCDIVGRKLVSGEFPIGIVTSLIGGPFFLYLLMRRSFTDWESN